MKNEIGKIILLITSDVILIFLTILFYNFVMKNNINHAQAVVINNGGSTTILITYAPNWKNVVMNLLFIITINFIIISILKIVEYKKIINVPLKYKILIIIAFDILSLIFLFPSLIMALVSTIIKYYNILKLKKQ
jgi:hypothetical protein